VFRSSTVNGNEVVTVDKVEPLELEMIARFCEIAGEQIPSSHDARMDRDTRVVDWLFDVVSEKEIPEIKKLAMVSHPF
jgi:hypothetical protein